MSTISVLDHLARIRRFVNATVFEKLKPMGIGQKQAIIMRYLGRFPGSSLAELSRATLTDPGAMVRAVDSLTQSGWVTRKEHPKDRRCWVLHLSAEGKKRIAWLEKMSNQLSEQITEPLTGKEREQFMHCLKKINAFLETKKAHEGASDDES